MTCTAATNSAPSSRYSTASDAMTTTSDRALLMGWFCASRLTAPATQIAPKTRNRTKCSILNCSTLQSEIYNLKFHERYATTKAVITRFAIASGNRNFHPKAISWS